MLVESAGPSQKTEGWFIVGSDSAAKLTVFAGAGRFPIEQGVDAAANVECRRRCDGGGNEGKQHCRVEVVREVELLLRTKSMQQRKKIGSAGTC